MRSTTTSALLRAIVVLLAIVTLTPQDSVAQLNFESRKILLQGSTSGALTLEVPATVSSYSLTLPSSAPNAGSLMYKGASGMLWTNTASDGAVLTTDGTSVSWASPSASANKNWSIQGNTLTATGTFGTLSNNDINFLTNNTSRMTLTAGGSLGIGTSTPSTLLQVSGTFSATGASTFGSTVSISDDLSVGTTNFTVDGPTGNTAIAGTLGVTGAATMSNTLAVTGNFSVNSTMFTVAAGSGNTAVAGTLGVTGATTLSSTLGVTGAATMSSTLAVTGNFSVNSTMFTVDASNGNTVVAGTLNQTAGQVTFGGNVDATNGLDVTTGNFTVGTSNFIVAPATGNTTIVGTLSQTSSGSQVSLAGNVDATNGLDITGANLTVGSDKFVVTVGSGNTAIKGDVNLDGTTNDLQMNGQSGTAGDVLVSGGSNVTPSWSSIGSAIGIRAAGVVAASGVTATSAITATGLEATDAIIVTLQTSSGSTVVGTVTDRNDGADTFTVTFSGSFTGSVNYLVIKTF